MFPIRIPTVKRNIRKRVAYTFKCKERGLLKRDKTGDEKRIRWDTTQ
jgi:hypothetical protein